MTLRWDRMCEFAGGAAFFEVFWDSEELQEDGTMLDPTATREVRRIRYQNLDSMPHSIRFGTPSRTETVPPGTPFTETAVPRGYFMGIPFQCW
jgi:hypothetical protein